MRIVLTAKCMKCDWTAEGAKAGKEAEKHSKQPGHPTVSSADPAEVES